MKKNPFNKPVYYIHGPESCLLDDFLEQLKSSVLTPGFESMNYHSYYADNLNMAEALTEVKTMPAFSDKRVVVIKNASALRAEQTEALLDYLSDPSPWSILVFVSNKAKPGLQGKFGAAIKANAEVKFLRAPNEQRACEWVVQEASARGKSISREATESLIGLTGLSLTSLKSELEKIILFTGDKKQITADDVAEAGLDVKSDDTFDLTDAIGKKDLKKAFYIYKKLSTEPSLMVIGGIAWQIREFIKVKSAMRDGMSGNKSASAEGVSSYQIKKYGERCRHFTMKELKRDIRYLFEANMNLKGSGLPESVIMTELIIRLCR